MKYDVLILMGGGIDSTALLQFYLEKNYSVLGLHFDYSQPSLSGELSAIENIAKYYSVEICREVLGINPTQQKNFEFKCRNALFFLAGAVKYGDKTSLISAGIHHLTSSPYYDCTPDFIQNMEKILSGYFSGSLQIDVPFISLDKADIVQYCLEKNVPVELTYSCESGSQKPCGECPSCLDRITLGVFN